MTLIVENVDTTTSLGKEVTTASSTDNNLILSTSSAENSPTTELNFDTTIFEMSSLESATKTEDKMEQGKIITITITCLIAALTISLGEGHHNNDFCVIFIQLNSTVNRTSLILSYQEETFWLRGTYALHWKIYYSEWISFYSIIIVYSSLWDSCNLIL